MLEPRIGTRMWTALHEWAWQLPRDLTAEQQRDARDWLAAWPRSLPAGCQCRWKWEAILRDCPPTLHSGPETYWWTVAAHDRVNLSLGKPLAAPEWSSHHPLAHTLLIGR